MDLGEIEFLDLLRGIAGENDFDPCVDVAFAGTEEADASDAVDAVVAEEDRGDDFDAVKKLTQKPSCLTQCRSLECRRPSGSGVRSGCSYQREHALLFAGNIDITDTCPRTPLCIC